MRRATATRSLGPGDQPRLTELKLELGTAGDAGAGGVEAYTLLADPAHGGAGVGEQGDGRGG